jgi:hypothetical protein
MKQIAAFISRCLRAQSRLEWAVIALIIAILVTLLTPQTRWASSGDIRLPVRVFVFDAIQCTPISDAKVMLFRAAPVANRGSLAERQEQFQIGLIGQLPQKFWTATDADGIAVVEYEFRTGASHNRPVNHAHLNFTWVRVEADGFGGAQVPVRHESQPTSVLKQQGEILIQIGLVPIQVAGKSMVPE